MGLIKTALPASAMVKRHGNQSIPVVIASMAVIGLGQPIDQLRVAIMLVSVFESDHRFEHLALRPIPGPGPLEMPDMLGAFVAGEFFGIDFQAGKGLAALAAIGLLDPHWLRLGRFRPRKSEAQGAFSPVSGTTDG